MNINATLLGQMIAFGLFVWFTMKFVWPPLTQALAERTQRIADGLAAAEQGQTDLVSAKEKVGGMIREARGKAVEIADQAQYRANEIMEEARKAAVTEGERIKAQAHAEIEQEAHRARDELRNQVAALAVAGASRLLEREIDASAHADLLDKLITEL